MSELYLRSVEKLELNKILEMLAACAGSKLAKDACTKLMPSSDLEDVRDLLAQTDAASLLSTNKGYPGFSNVCDIGPSVDRAGRGGVLQPMELLKVAGVLRCSRTTKSYLGDEEAPQELKFLFDGLITNRYLEDKIFTAIVSEEEIADSASPELADIRRKMRVQSARIRESLQKIISSSAYSKILQEPIITIRQGRYVVPVKSECKNDLPGMVHDVSSTGSTYFIEPMSAVNANNELRELQLKEEQEIQRILAELSAEVSNHGEDLLLCVDLLVQLDVIFAKAKLGYQMHGGSPEMNDKGVVVLRNARHPLIEPKTCVPISLHLGKDFDSMIITGPNTGGKTVTLKTVGILTLMAECGLHIPAGDGSVLSTFDSILADIGDEQSIAQSLSTFSSHMRTIVDIIAQCDNRTLVLFDELGAGTDPAEGAALAVALIEYCRKMGSFVMATTHYAELKLYAMRTKGVINASCEFDVETLRPTYRLLIGIPGKSNAFAISRKLGLDEDILKEAADLVSKTDRDFDDVISQLEQQRQQMEAARLEAERLRKETAGIREKSIEYEQQLKLEREKALESARKEAEAIIEEARRAANAASDEIKAIKKHLSEHADTQGINQRQTELRRCLNDAQTKLRENQVKQERPKPTRGILIGDTVELLSLGTKASVIAINKDGSYQLRAGILTMNAKPEEVWLLEGEDTKKPKPTRPAHSGKAFTTQSAPSEVDLRGMDSVEAICVMEQFMDVAMRNNAHCVRIIHGKGTGVLRQAVQQALRKNKFVKSYRLGAYGEGEDGVTIAEFK